MAEWFFEPGHTAAGFCARHMMVTHVRGHFKNVHGILVFDPLHPRDSRVDVHIDSKTLWTGEPDRDAHLRSADFLNVEHYPEITFKGDQVEILGDHDYVLGGNLTIRGVMRTVPLKVRYLGQWQTRGGRGTWTKDPRRARVSSLKPRLTSTTSASVETARSIRAASLWEAKWKSPSTPKPFWKSRRHQPAFQSWIAW